MKAVKTSWHSVALLMLVSIGCSDPVGIRPGSNAWISLDLVTPAQDTAAAVAIDMSYRRNASEPRPLLSTTLRIAAGSHALSVTVDITECLGDPDHLGASDECNVDLVLTLLDRSGSMLDRKSIGPLMLKVGVESSAPPVSLSTSPAVFEDDFEGASCLASWIVGGRRLAGANVADCVTREGSTFGHLYKTSFTEVTLSPAVGAFAIADWPTFDFDLEVWVFSAGAPGPTFYSMSGVVFVFRDAQGGHLGSVEYIATSTTYRLNASQGDPTWGVVSVAPSSRQSFSLTTEEILSHINIDEGAVATVEMLLDAYTSAYVPDMRAELWIDNVAVRRGIRP
jgi:hypothetical protein